MPTPDLMHTFVQDIKAILEGNLAGYCTGEESATYDLPMPKVYDYEINTFDHLPSILLLGETNRVVGREVASEIFEGQVMLYLVVADTKGRYPARLYLYEKAIRACIYANKYRTGTWDGERYYFVGDSVYGLQREVGSRLIKDLALTIHGRLQYSYA